MLNVGGVLYRLPLSAMTLYSSMAGQEGTPPNAIAEEVSTNKSFLTMMTVTPDGPKFF